MLERSSFRGPFFYIKLHREMRYNCKKQEGITMQLQFYEPSHQSLIDQYELTEQQLRFTRHAKECVLLKSETRSPILALVEGKLVTYFDLHRTEGVKPYSNNPNAILLRAFSTDFRVQGKGYATKVLKLLPNFVRAHFPNVNEIVLAVNIENHIAKELYEKHGFIDFGERREGAKGELIIMSYRIE